MADELTKEDIVPILEKHYDEKTDTLDFMAFTREILAKAKPIILKDLLNKPDLLTGKGRDVIIRLVKEMEG